MNVRASRWRWSTVLFLGLLGACEAILPIAGRLLATAVGNYDAPYGKMVQELTDVLRSEVGSTVAARTRSPIALEVALLRQEERDGAMVPVAMANGEVLQWRGSLEDSDRFKVFFRPSEDCFVYVVLVDGTGFVQVLHPPAAQGIATRAGEGRFLPDGGLDLAYAVDRHPGIETVYFVAARERRVDLERALQPFLQRVRPELAAPQAVAALGGDFLELGVAARSTGEAEVAVGDGNARFDTSAFVQTAGRDLVVTRWFDHR